MSIRSKLTRRALLTGAAALASYRALAQSITPQIGGGIGLGFDGGLGGAGKAAPFIPLPGSSIDLNFATAQTFGAPLSNLSVTRAQTVPSYVTNADGTLTACAANALRIGKGTGLLIEGPSTNLILQSGNITFNSGPWSSFVNNSGSLTVTPNQGLAPDGASQMSKITINRTSTADFAQVNQTFTGTATAYSGGFYVQAFSSADIGKTITVALFNGSASTNAFVVLTGGIQRVAISNVNLAAAACQLIIGYNSGDFAATGQVNFLCGMAQAEVGPGLTSYIPVVSTPVTRNGDVIAASGTVLAAYQLAAVTQFARVANLNSAANGGRLGAGFNASPNPGQINSATTLSMWTGSADIVLATVGNSASFLSGTVNAVSSLSASGVSLVANGGTEVTSATTLPAVTSAAIGSDGSSNFLSGYLSRLAIWNSQLPSATRIALSQTFNLTSLVISGQNNIYMVPNNVPLSGTFVMVHHGAGATETDWLTNSLTVGVREALLAQGHIISGCNAAGDNWGNTAGINAYAAQWADVQTRFPSINKLVFFAGSMGGMTSQLTIAAATMPVRGWYAVFPACNLAEEYSLTFTAAINTAYNIPTGGTYAVQTAGHDPVLLSGSSFPLRMRFTGSPADTIVPRAQNGVRMQALVAPFALESFYLNTIGPHGDPSNFIPSDVVNFFARC
jgi:hypothetical protein